MTATRYADKRGSLRAAYGPWAVVTGASDGIGRELAVGLAAAGLNLVLSARREEALNALATKLRVDHRIEARVLALDFTRVEAPRQLLAATKDIEVGLLVAAAGYGTSGPLIDAAPEPELEMVDVNCRAVLALAHGFAGRFAAQRRGGIVLMSSLVGWQGVPYAANYAATKAYIQSLSEGLRVELAPFGVDVLAAAPGPVSSGFAARAGMRMSKAVPARVVAAETLAALGRIGMVVPGSLSKYLTYSLSTLPRGLRVRIMAQVMKGMTKHRGTKASGKPQPA